MRNLPKTTSEQIAALGFRLPLAAIKGAGDVASGVALRLHRAGFPLLMTELWRPTPVRRTVAFAMAVTEAQMSLEGVTAERAGPENFLDVLARGRLPVLPGVEADFLEKLAPAALVEATLSKRNTGLGRREGRVTIALGPGYTAGVDADAVVETQRGHFLGRVIFEGPALPDTGRPGLVGGFDIERLIKSPAAGPVEFFVEIGAAVEAGQAIGRVGTVPVRAAISGIVRGAIQNGLDVPENFKIGDIDPRPDAAQYIHSPSDKARAVGGGVLEALMFFLSKKNLI